MKTESSNDNKELFSVDYIFGKQLQLKQMKTGYRFGSDAVLLASYIRADNGILLDLGAGVGAVSLGIAWRYPKCKIIAVEKDPEIANLLRENVIRNDLSNQVAVEQRSIEHLPSSFVSKFDHVMAIPPFHKMTGTRSRNSQRNLAHMGDGLTLVDWLGKAIWACKPKGYVSFMIRADRTDEAVSILHNNKMGEITLFPIPGTLFFTFPSAKNI